MKGIIKNINNEKKYGFIKSKNHTDDIFFQPNKCTPKITKVAEGKEVNFDLTRNSKGPLAINVTLVDQGIKKGDDEMTDKEYFLKYAITLKDDDKAIDYNIFCDHALNYADAIQKDVTTSMIRKVYSRIMLAQTRLDLQKLRPQFAYIAGKNTNPNKKNSMIKDFMNLLEDLVKQITEENEKDEIKNFKSFVEAIVAYRKYVGKDV